MGILKDLGYNVASTGNADNYNYQGANIKVKKSKSEFLNLLKKDLPSSSSTDAVIIIGK